MGQKIKSINNSNFEAHTNSAKSVIMFLTAFVLTLFLIGIGSYDQGGQIVKVGDVALELYVAPRDTVDQVATEKLKEAAASSVVPKYKSDINIQAKTIIQITELFKEMNEVVVVDNRENSNSGQVDDGQTVVHNPQDGVLTLALPVVFTDRQLSIYGSMTATQRKNLEDSTVKVISDAYRDGVSAEALETAKAEAFDTLEAEVINEDLQTMAYMIISAALEPNLVLDEEAMEEEREEKRNEVADVLIRKNQKIIGEGEIIDQDILDRLTVLGLVNTVNSNDEASLYSLLGNVIITSLLFAFAFLYLNGGVSSKNKTENKMNINEQRMLFWIYISMIFVMRLMSGSYYFTLIPLELFAMLISALLGKRTALVFHSCCCMIGCIIFAGDVEFLIYSFISGYFGAILIQNTNKRSQTVPVAMGMALVNFMSVIGIALFFRDAYNTDIFVLAGLGALVGLITVVVTLGSLPFWEQVFEANTPLYLLEFTNPNHELLRRMMIEAPATYHHSLLVANLAETATYAVGGNIALARAGAYYHDIGKLKMPMYFAENQTGYNPHDKLPPETSAEIITHHTTNGYKLGEEYKLPKPVLNIMTEHHGNSVVKYFYYKALKEYGAENVNEDDYRYKGQIPQSRESAIIMLADTSEAAVRAMLGNGKTLSEASEFIKTLIKDKLDDGQLDESHLKINELDVIRNAFMEVFHGMYHERVSYPKAEEIKEAKGEVKAEENVSN